MMFAQRVLASSAEIRHTSGMPRFVLLRHECPPSFGKPSHWDLMLEADAALVTWSLSELPGAAGVPVAAILLADHRHAYLDYEGPLSGDRGEVRQIDAGRYDVVDRTAASWHVRFDGEVLSGLAVLALDGGEAWTLTLSDVLAEPAP